MENKSILVVDDSPTMREGIRRLLADSRYNIDTAEDGLQAITKLKTGNKYDLMTLDVDMGSINGFDTLARIRSDENNPNASLPVIFVTSNDTLADRQRGFELGATDYVSKKEIEQQLRPLVDSLLKQGTEFEDIAVLVVDDSRVSRDMIAGLLENRGAKVYKVPDGLQGIKLLKEQMDEIDIVVTDQLMQPLDAYQFTSFIRRNLGLKDLPVIVLSADEERPRLIDLFKIGISDYLQKPFIKEEFIARFTAHMQAAKASKMLKKNYGELKETYQKLQQTQQEVIRLERQNSAMAMAVTANHELNQPLMIAQGNIDLLQMALEAMNADEKLTKVVGNIAGAVERMGKILEDFKQVKEVDFKDYESLTQMATIKTD